MTGDRLLRGTLRDSATWNGRRMLTDMARRFTVVIERDRDGLLVGTVPCLPACHTQGKSMDELMERIREAIKLCLEVQEEDSCLSLELVGVLSVAV